MHPVHKGQHNWLAIQTNNKVFQRYLERLKGTVVDLGCGSSPYKKDILEVGAKYIGVDWQNSLHDRLNVDVISDLNSEIDLADEACDCAIAFHVMEHLREPEHFLSEVRRILKPGGFVLIAVPFNWHLHEEPHDYYRFTPYCLDYLLKKHKFADVNVTSEGGFFGTITLKGNYALRRLLGRRYSRLAAPYWYFNQHLALLLDRRFECPRECTAVTAVAVKPS